MITLQLEPEAIRCTELSIGSEIQCVCNYDYLLNIRIYTEEIKGKQLRAYDAIYKKGGKYTDARIMEYTFSVCVDGTFVECIRKKVDLATIDSSFTLKFLLGKTGIISDYRLNQNNIIKAMALKLIKENT